MPLTSEIPSGSHGPAARSVWTAPAGPVGIRAGEPGFPSALTGLTPALWVRGQVDCLGLTPRVTVVGSREASGRGLGRAHALGQALAEQGALVISGGAIGIDAAAHEGALVAGGATCAVLGTGVDRVYPQRHAGLFERIAQAGCLLSVLPPGAPARRAHFPQRNRIMAALADVVVVVEARLNSGTGYTADAARKLGRRVVCFADSPGTAAMAAAGAVAVGSVAEVLALLDRSAYVPGNVDPDLSPELAPQLPELPQLIEDLDPLDPNTQRVLGALSPSPLDLDEMCARTGLSAADCAAAVVELELRGRCSRLPGGRYIGHAPLC